MALGDLDDLAHRADVAIHRIDALERHDPRPRGVERRELALEVGDIVVAPDDALGPRVADALDHARVVLLVREDHRPRQPRPEGRERRPVRDIARGEQKRRRLAVQVGEFRLECRVQVRGARDVARAPCPHAMRLDRLDHGAGHGGVLAHAQIIVRAPDRHRIGRAPGVAGGARKGAAMALELGKDAIVAFALQLVELGLEQAVMIHWGPPGVCRGAQRRILARIWAPASSSARVSGRERAAP